MATHFGGLRGKNLNCGLVTVLHILQRANIGNLSKGVFERRTPTGSKASSVLICLDAAKFGLLSIFTKRDDLPESLGKTTAQECKKSTYGWLASLKNVVIMLNCNPLLKHLWLAEQFLALNLVFGLIFSGFYLFLFLCLFKFVFLS